MTRHDGKLPDRGSNQSDEPDEFAGLRDQVEAVGRKAQRTIDLGPRAMVISTAVLVLLIGQVLPWMDGTNAWGVLLSHGEAVGRAGAVPRLFVATSTAFGVLASILGLVTRRWGMAWICALGGWFASVDGLLAIWSRQSSSVAPGFGLVLAEIAMIVLAIQWWRTAWSRPGA